MLVVCTTATHGQIGGHIDLAQQLDMDHGSHAQFTPNSRRPSEKRIAALHDVTCKVLRSVELASAKGTTAAMNMRMHLLQRNPRGASI